MISFGAQTAQVWLVGAPGPTPHCEPFTLRHSEVLPLPRSQLVLRRGRGPFPGAGLLLAPVPDLPMRSQLAGPCSCVRWSGLQEGPAWHLRAVPCGALVLARFPAVGVLCPGVGRVSPGPREAVCDCRVSPGPRQAVCDCPLPGSLPTWSALSRAASGTGVDASSSRGAAVSLPHAGTRDLSSCPEGP
uniref:Uncharacterized protein n=1 Tax=Rangifer tarandus platyrhynchus TaxID=3082113 RepID=A0ACB0DQA7_RANTA|nr:unnamed protein product [Rangifer tarandus platyrhynchus]